MSCEGCGALEDCKLAAAVRFRAELANKVKVGSLYYGSHFKGLVSKKEYIVTNQYIDAERVVAVELSTGFVRTFEKHAKVEQVSGSTPL